MVFPIGNQCSDFLVYEIHMIDMQQIFSLSVFYQRKILINFNSYSFINVISHYRNFNARI